MDKLATEQLEVLRSKLQCKASEVGLRGFEKQFINSRKWADKNETDIMLFELMLVSTAQDQLKGLWAEAKGKGFCDELLPLQGCGPMTYGDFVSKRLKQVEAATKDNNGNVRTAIRYVRDMHDFESLLDTTIGIYFWVGCNGDIAHALCKNYYLDPSLQFCKLDAVLDNTFLDEYLYEAPITLGLKLTIKGQILSELGYCQPKGVYPGVLDIVIQEEGLSDKAIILNSQQSFYYLAKEVAEIVLANPDLMNAKRAEKIGKLFDNVVLSSKWQPDYNPKTELWLAASVYCAELSRNETLRSRYKVEELAEEFLNFIRNNNILARYN